MRGFDFRGWGVGRLGVFEETVGEMDSRSWRISRLDGG
jgi:hypothetical protein